VPFLYVTHPEVVIDPVVPMPRWGLATIGAERALAFAKRQVVPIGAPIFSSTERKAVELAEIIAGESGGRVETDEQFGENDRSSTGFLHAERFEQVVECFFGDPDNGPEGWESARAAQQRIVAAVTAATAGMTGPAIFCGHGAVGTLLKCHVGARGIARSEDQRVMASKGGGNCFVFDLQPLRLLSDWVAMEDFAGV
jgi:broad specificity phosphatase PhoE